MKNEKAEKNALRNEDFYFDDFCRFETRANRTALI